ncbi:MAG: glutamate-5-semialdehyde dehydrogenase [Candidatus Omnitrophica bacterium]|nr:glutamate-5-semialdehyde dehydrogenase [Candidatus Omnitrophota bacterium]
MSRYVNKLVREAKEASYQLAQLSTAEKNRALRAMAGAVRRSKKFIIEENRKDLRAAQKNGLAKSMIDRLALTEKRVAAIAQSLKEVASLPDPLGKTIAAWRRPNGLRLKKVRVPLGVVLIIYEARPNVTSDCVGLLFKTGNVGILRGGRNALRSNQALGRVLSEALASSGIPFPAFFVVEKPQRTYVDELLRQEGSIDLVIPRGGESLIRTVVEKSRVPVIKHYKGICHLFIDESADIKQALSICVNAKVQRPSVCNAVETILVHKEIAKEFLPRLKKEFSPLQVQMRGDPAVCRMLPGTRKATEKDWRTEYLDLIVSLRVVKNVEEAIAHINRYGSHHTDSILTRNRSNAKRFVREIDSACCFVNASTRFSDGFQFGLGAEIGISTDKLHARGPMGLEELTTYKYIVEGQGQVRA